MGGDNEGCGESKHGGETPTAYGLRGEQTGSVEDMEEGDRGKTARRLTTSCTKASGSTLRFQYRISARAAFSKERRRGGEGRESFLAMTARAAAGKWSHEGVSDAMTYLW